MRRQSRFPVSWPVLYGGDELLAEGTVLDLTQIGWRIAGAMPVRPGMQLALAVWVPEKREPLRVERATVLWVNGCEFAIEAHEMAPCDQTWVRDFLSQKLGLSWISRAGDQGTSLATKGSMSHAEAGLTQLSSSSVENLLQLLLTAQASSPDAPAQTRRNSDLDPLDDRGRTVYDRAVEETWGPAFHIVRGMIAKRAARERTGRDSIADN
jgi:hypothetical protein